MSGLTGFIEKSCISYTDLTKNAYDQMRELENLTRGPFKDADRAARDILGSIPTPDNIIDSALGDLTNAVGDAIPDLSDVGTLIDILNRCTPLKNLFNGTGSLLDAVDYMSDMVSDIVGDVFDSALSTIMSAIPEFNVGLDSLGVGDFFDDLKVPDFLGVLDGLLNCISDMCPGQSTDDILSDVIKLQDDMFFTDIGSFDTEAMLTSVGVSTAQFDNVLKLQDSMGVIRNNAVTTVTNQVTDLFNVVETARSVNLVETIQNEALGAADQITSEATKLVDALDSNDVVIQAHSITKLAKQIDQTATSTISGIINSQF